ncbi:gamma subclass chorismate mutase AroQ [Herbiconiux sp. P15]|uniref:gamma subclass chorismate mutase AroQ n=1 Tax=Herbiconiux liukaitaii TaxID=3342799 RepID=UPI0035BA2CBC
MMRLRAARSTRSLGAMAGLLIAAGVLAGCSATVTDTPPAADAAVTPAASSTESPGEADGEAAGDAAFSVPDDAFAAVLALVVERLDTGDTVAASKFFSGQPVTDEAREAAVLDAAAVRASEVGADAGYVAAVFADQITASKQIQQQLLDEWAAGSATPPASAPDLATEVRPILDRITAELVPALGEVQEYRDDPGCAEALAAGIAAATPPASAAGQAALPAATASLCD